LLINSYHIICLKDERTAVYNNYFKTAIYCIIIEQVDVLKSNVYDKVMEYFSSIDASFIAPALR
jgi:hypothetical protein